MKYSALIVAAGSGTRMKLGYNKVYAEMKDGRSILETTVSVFLNDEDCEQIVIVTDIKDYLAHHCTLNGKITLCKGGDSRQSSVHHGLLAVTGEYVLIHDGARPFIQQEQVNALKEALKNHDACLLMVPCKDTIKKVVDGYVIETYDRSTLMAAQTPQAFKTSLIKECMKKALDEGFIGTDDTSLVERYGGVRVKAVEGAYSNIKITTPEDLR